MPPRKANSKKGRKTEPSPPARVPHGTAVSIDSNYFPHIIDRIIHYADAFALLKLRSLSHSFQDRVDPVLFKYVTAQPIEADNRSPCLVVRASPESKDVALHLDLDIHQDLINFYTRILDVVDVEARQLDLPDIHVDTIRVSGDFVNGPICRCNNFIIFKEYPLDESSLPCIDPGPSKSVFNGTRLQDPSNLFFPAEFFWEMNDIVLTFSDWSPPSNRSAYRYTKEGVPDGNAFVDGTFTIVDFNLVDPRWWGYDKRGPSNDQQLLASFPPHSGALVAPNPASVDPKFHPNSLSTKLVFMTGPEYYATLSPEELWLETHPPVCTM
ncbi:uncharacterized protein EHS24_001691 [Apiotrichum porosum]|uniref:F-box domain-containing protein n=1 Tax=Apiotrichum porosum TaxID=105984 RepID=A0A427XJ20_9TREE|nr:uncharacterized protein EHS24_001691 [Apiotrichum porosum]RSH78783.1 hypothetical protein EHS24_001691 [Apiotrichum porosum]